MLLTVSIGNTRIEVGALAGDDILFAEYLNTEMKATTFEYASRIRSVMAFHGYESSPIEGAIISSVVPPLTKVLQNALEKSFGVSALVVGPGLKNGLRIRIDDPKQLGANMAVTAVGALVSYRPPLIIIDMGSATTITALAADGSFLGGSIMPGLQLSLNALVAGTSQLPRIDTSSPRQAIGRNTVDSMKSGVIYGEAARFDGLIDRFEKEMGTQAQVIATGVSAREIIPHCRHRIEFDANLRIRGLADIYRRNS